jgi:PEGA domain
MKRVVLLTLATLLAAHPALAGDDKAADAMISRGLELRREGKSLEALEMFQRAHAIAPSPRTFGQLGLVESAVDHWADAEEHLTAALGSPQDPWVHKNHAPLEQALTLVKTHVGQIALTGPAGATVLVSGKNVGALPLPAPVRVTEGSAIVTAAEPGFKPFMMSVPVEPGKETQLRIALEPVDVAAPAPVAASESSAPGTDLRTHYSRRVWIGGTLIGVGAGVAAWGIIWIALDGHGASGVCSAGAPAGCQPVYNTKTVGWILTAGGAAAAAVGGVVLYGAKRSGGDVGVALGPSSLLLGGHF